MSNYWLLKRAIRCVETEEFEAKPCESFGDVVNPAEIVDILSDLYDIADIEVYVRMDRVENVYFMKNCRLYHTIRFKRRANSSTDYYSLVIDITRYESSRFVRNTIVSWFVALFIGSFFMF